MSLQLPLALRRTILRAQFPASFASSLAVKSVIVGLLFVIVLIVVGVLAVGPQIADSRFNRVSQLPPYDVSPSAEQFHQTLFVADLHADFLLWQRDLLRRYDRGHVDLPRLVEGNVGLQVFSVVTKSPWGQNYQRTESDSDRITLLALAQRWPPATWTSLLDRALYQANRLYDAAARTDGQLHVIETRQDFADFLNRRDEASNTIAGLLAIEGLHALDGDLANVDVLYDAGYRMMAPVHLFDNKLGGSASGTDKGGLTDFGRQVVQRLDTLGILIDLAHASSPLIDDVLALTERPVVVSHTGVQGTCPGPRNLSDDQLRRLAATGGVIGIGYWPGAVCEGGIDAIVRAMRYTADLVGIDHVALGSDFDGTVETPFDTSGLAQLTEALLEAGFSEDEIRQIMGGNVRRLLLETLPRE